MGVFVELSGSVVLGGLDRAVEVADDEVFILSGSVELGWVVKVDGDVVTTLGGLVKLG